MVPLAYYLASKLAQTATDAPGVDNCNFSDKTQCKGTDGEFTTNTILPEIKADAATVKPLLQMTFAIIGFIAVLTIIFAGYKYITSQGNPQDHKQAWQTIMYASIGLMIALSAEIIVTFALGRL